MIEDYEEKSYSLEDWSQLLPYEILQHLLESSTITEADLQEVINCDHGLISKIINGELAISLEQAKKLGRYFKVSPSLFLSD